MNEKVFGWTRGFVRWSRLYIHIANANYLHFMCLKTRGTEVASLKKMKMGRQLMLGISLLALNCSFMEVAIAQDESRIRKPNFIPI